jgi:hypothetical protein
MTPENEQTAATKLPYEKPMLVSISLVAEQVLGGPCKNISTNSTGYSGNPCVAQLCLQDLGS